MVQQYPIKKYGHFALPLALGVVLLPLPLLGDFHLESAILASFAGCLWAGWRASRDSSGADSDISSALYVVGWLYVAGLPLLVFALFTGCFSIHGLGFWLLYPIPSVFFGYAVGRLCRLWGLPWKSAVTVSVLLLTAIGGFLLEFFTLPQVYFFNHVWGGWPGPIYDESVRLSGSVFFFRFISLLWILILWHLPGLSDHRTSKWVTVASIIVLFLSYTQLSERGIISPPSYIQQQLGGKAESPHFKIYYDRKSYSQAEVERIALEHEFYLEEITQRLNLAKPDSNRKISSYLYAHAWQKKELVGAKFTSYVPVWLGEDQLHIAKQQLGGSLRHEMVHVLSKQFGNRLFNASWSIGLVEGLAVALAPDASSTSTIDQIVVSEKPLPTAEEMKNSLSPLGFYGGRSTVNYTTAGSFVSWLLSEYPKENFKDAYRTARLEEAYSADMEILVEGWHRHLDTVTVDSLDRQTAQRLFSIPSLFEQECPRLMTEFALAWDAYRLARAERDTVAMIDHLDKAIEAAPDNIAVQSEWTYWNLKAGNYTQVQIRSEVQDSAVDLQLLYADAFALTGDQRMAFIHFNEALSLLSQEPDSTYDEAVATRANETQWQYYLDMTYRSRLFELDTFEKLYYRTKIRLLRQAIEEERWEKLSEYAEALLELPTDREYMQNYVSIVHQLAYIESFGLVRKWIAKLETMTLRERQKQILENKRRWVQFLETVDRSEFIFNTGE